MTSPARENLRTDLLAEAGKLMRAHGHEQVSIRRVAANAGVSSGAPYHYFADRRSLLIEVAAEGFQTMNALAERMLANDDEPASLITALSNGFLDFCQDNPELADLMYESELTRPLDERLRPAFQASFDLILTAVTRASGLNDRALILSRTLSYWATIFGLARLSRNQLVHSFDGLGAESWRKLIVAEATAAVTR